MTLADTSPARTLVFSHGNSFPSGTYEVLFQHWRDAGFDVQSIEKFGHDPRYAVTNDWPHLVRQLHDCVRALDRPVYLVGHSLGGYVSMMLAHRHGEQVRGVVALDSPLVDGWRAASLGVVKSLGQMSRVVPSKTAAERRHEWSSLAEARAHFTAKRKFAAFDARVLADYLRHGTLAASDAPELSEAAPRTLSFQREIESAIYNAMPHELAQEFRRRPARCPIAFIGGTDSRELEAVGLEGTRRLVGSRLSWIRGSHLFPMERPDDTASNVLEWLQQFETDAAAVA